MKFFFDFFWSSVSRIVPTNVKGGIWEFLNIHSLEKWEKNEGGPSGDIEKICEKKSHKAENKPAQKKFWSWRDSNPCHFACQTSKKP